MVIYLHGLVSQGVQGLEAPPVGCIKHKDCCLCILNAKMAESFA